MQNIQYFQHVQHIAYAIPDLEIMDVPYWFVRKHLAPQVSTDLQEALSEDAGPEAKQRIQIIAKRQVAVNK